MAWSSIGYAGTVNDRQWAGMHPRVGQAAYGVAGFADWRVTAAAGTRVVQVAAGTGWGRGIMDTTDAVEVLPSLASVPSGTRWDLIVARRDWDAKTTTFKVVAGGSTKAIPPRTVSLFGGVDEQPLALVRVSAGSSAIAEIVDLRVFTGAGGAYARDELALQYNTQTGTVLRIGDVEYSRVLNGSGTGVWVSSNMGDTGWVNVTLGAKWAAVAGYPVRVRRIGDIVHLRGAVKHTTGASIMNIAAIPGGFRPTASVPLGVHHVSERGGFFGELFVNALGRLWVDEDYRTNSMSGGETLMLGGAWFVN